MTHRRKKGDDEWGGEEYHHWIPPEDKRMCGGYEDTAKVRVPKNKRLPIGFRPQLQVEEKDE